MFHLSKNQKLNAMELSEIKRNLLDIKFLAFAEMYFFFYKRRQLLSDGGRNSVV